MPSIHLWSENRTENVGITHKMLHLPHMTCHDLFTIKYIAKSLTQQLIQALQLCLCFKGIITCCHPLICTLSSKWFNRSTYVTSSHQQPPGQTGTDYRDEWKESHYHRVCSACTVIYYTGKHQRPQTCGRFILYTLFLSSLWWFMLIVSNN